MLKEYQPRTTKVKVGLAALCASWFKEVGHQGQSSQLAATLSQDYVTMVTFLEGCFDQVVAPGVITTSEEAVHAIRQFQVEQVDALVLVHIMWSEDQPLITLLDGCPHLPLLLWNYHPTGGLPQRLSITELFRCSGTAGMLQGSAPMQRRHAVYHMVSGSPDDAGLKEALRQYCVALGIRKQFASLAAGQIAGRCEAMTGTYVDETALRTRLGVRLVSIGAREYAAQCSAVAEERVDAYRSDVVAGRQVIGVSDATLRLACRNTLALDDLVAKHDLGAVAIQDLDPELHRLAGIRPCLYPPLSIERGIPYGMEGDLTATVGLLAAMRASGAPGMFTEVFTFDPQENLLLMGHAGVHDPRLAAEDGITLVPDMEYRFSDRCEGAWMEFVLAAGAVTCVSFYDTGHACRMTVFEGDSLGAPRRLEGFAHALIRPVLHVRQLLPRLVQLGLTQHFAIVPGRCSSTLARWCALSGIEFCLVQPGNGELPVDHR